MASACTRAFCAVKHAVAGFSRLSNDRIRNQSGLFLMINIFRSSSSLAIGFFLTAVNTTAGAQKESIDRLPPMTSLCISEESTGFNWRGNRWNQANFAKGDKYIVNKLPSSKYDSAKARAESKLFFCEDPSVTDLSKPGENFSGWIGACYQIKEMGKESYPTLESRRCTELWEQGRLKKISCEKHIPQFFFNPDGSFIRYPWHSDIEKTAEKKDSLVVEVGSCSKIN